MGVKFGEYEQGLCMLQYTIANMDFDDDEMVLDCLEFIENNVLIDCDAQW